MKLSGRLFAVIGAPALLAGLFMAGSAGVKPAVKVPTGGDFVASVEFTAVVIPGTTTFTIDSTSCEYWAPEAEGSCFLGGAGTLTSGGQPQTVNIAITTSLGNASLSLTGLHSDCATGTGAAVPNKGNPFPIVAEMSGPLKLTKTGMVSGTICIFGVGTTTPLDCD